MIGVLIEEEIRTQKYVRTWGGEDSAIYTPKRCGNIPSDTLILEVQAPGLPLFELFIAPSVVLATIAEQADSAQAQFPVGE